MKDCNLARAFHVVSASHYRSSAGVVKMYETRLKELNPHLTDITYDVSHLFAFIDSLGDLSALAYVLAGRMV